MEYSTATKIVCMYDRLLKCKSVYMNGFGVYVYIIYVYLMYVCMYVYAFVYIHLFFV